ncbi:MAG: aromatic amino acid DMT transporter YddG [archaeon]
MTQSDRARGRSTIAGILALIFWGSTIAFQRSLAEKLGTLAASSCILLLSGSLGCIYLISKPHRFRRVIRLPAPYLVGCGALFVIYMASLYTAVGIAPNRNVVLEVGLINYLWPSLTLIFAIPILGKKARSSLGIGILCGMAGICLATANPDDLFLGMFLDDKIQNLPSYILALSAAVSWGLYSNLARRWSGQSKEGAVPLFLSVAGLTLLGLSTFFPAGNEWTRSSLFELIYMAIFPTTLAYVFWDDAMRRGRIMLVASLSYFTPLISTIISAAYLDIRTGWNLWAGCLLTIAGAAICNISVGESEEENP